MMYQVEFTNKDGYSFATPVITESQKNIFIEGLDMQGLSYTIFERPEKLWQCAIAVFDIQLVPAARKAIQERKTIDGMFTFGDPNRLAKKDRLIKVQLTDGRIKNAYTVDLWHATAQEIKDFKAKIGYKHLSPVLGLI